MKQTSDGISAPTRILNVWFGVTVALMVLVFPFVPGLPLVGAVVAPFTPLRESKWRLWVIWGIAGVYAFFMVLVLASSFGWADWMILDQEDYSPEG